MAFLSRTIIWKVKTFQQCHNLLFSMIETCQKNVPNPSLKLITTRFCSQNFPMIFHSHFRNEQQNINNLFITNIYFSNIISVSWHKYINMSVKNISCKCFFVTHLQFTNLFGWRMQKQQIKMIQQKCSVHSKNRNCILERGQQIGVLCVLSTNEYLN